MTDTGPYRVLARKYRPQSFAEVIGQEAMVRTLSNAIATGRIAHAFMLTGVRGVGKTTTARIVARALNCVGADGSGGPTIAPCGECVHCRSIAEDRHVDVIEMDAASRTGVDDIRDLTEGMRYRPVSARFKIYIIDEVHMLSKNAFNALLKTLEEPPPDVKFVFATTEVHRVPVTVLSRCQRFSLRRVPVEQLVEHYRRIAEAEGIAIEPAALGLIARAADGSVRDGLSLLDQAIALSAGQRRSRRPRCATCSASPTAAWSGICSRPCCAATPAARSNRWMPLPGRRRPADRIAGPARPDAFRDPAEADARGRHRRPARRGRARARPPAWPRRCRCRCWRGPGRCC